MRHVRARPFTLAATTSAHIHNTTRIISIPRRLELCKAIPLMLRRDPVLWQVDIRNGTSLKHELPYEGIRCSVVEVADVAGRILVAILLGWAAHCVRAMRRWGIMWK